MFDTTESLLEIFRKFQFSLDKHLYAIEFRPLILKLQYYFKVPNSNKLNCIHMMEFHKKRETIKYFI